MAKVMKYYYDLMSQPSRALYIFLKLNPQIKTEFCPVALRKGEHLTQEYEENINRFRRVPCIIDGENQNFKLAESVAIFRYLNETKTVDSHWYPKDNLMIRARIDEFMEWQHLSLRAGCAMYFRRMVIDPRLYGRTDGSEEVIQFIKKMMETSLDTFEKMWLSDTSSSSSSNKYLFGDKISFPDLLAACEIEQTKITGYDPCAGRPKLTKWLNLVKQIEFYNEANIFVNKLIRDVSKL